MRRFLGLVGLVGLLFSAAHPLAAPAVAAPAATATPVPGTVSDEVRCKIVKLKAMVKELKDKAQCYERSFKANVPVSQACFARAEQKRARLYERAEERGGCKTTGGGSVLGAKIDAFLQEATRALEGLPVAGAEATPAAPATPGAEADASKAGAEEADAEKPAAASGGPKSSPAGDADSGRVAPDPKADAS